MKTKHTIVVTVEVEEGVEVAGRSLDALVHEEICTVEYRGTDPAPTPLTPRQPTELSTAQLAAILKDIPRTLVGDGGSPNVHFVTNQNNGAVLAVFIGDDTLHEAVAFADSRSEALMVEDRQNGIVHDNPAGEQLQDRLRIAEEAMTTEETA